MSAASTTSRQVMAAAGRVALATSASAFGLLAFALLAGTPAQAAPMATPITGNAVLRGATVHVGDGRVLTGASVAILDGRIAGVGADIAPPANARVIDCVGKHVTPGLFAIDTVLGLTEISAVRATQDSAEVGDVNPHVAGWGAFHADSELLGVAMAGGVLHAGVAPRGGLVPGLTSAMRLSGWTREDMVLRQPAALCVNWPSMSLDRRPDAKPPLDEQQRNLAARLDEIDEMILRAKAHHAGLASPASSRGGAAITRDLEREALAPVLAREVPVLVHADGVPEMRAALAWAKKHGLRLILSGARDAHRIAGEIAAAEVPVIIGATRALPARDFEPYDARFEGPVLLHRAGIKIAFNVGGDPFGAAMVRNLADEAATTIPWGMPPEEALRAITLTPAEMLGVADRVGSLAAGKEADLVVWDGPPLEITSRVVNVFMRGAEIPINDRHTRLYNTYRNRPR